MVPDLLDPFRYRNGTAVRGHAPNEEDLNDASDGEVEAFWDLWALEALPTNRRRDLRTEGPNLLRLIGHLLCRDLLCRRLTCSTGCRGIGPAACASLYLPHWEQRSTKFWSCVNGVPTTSGV